MKRQFGTTLTGVVALAIFLVGCGGGDSESEPLTKAEFIKQADAACSKQNKKLAADFIAYARSHKVDEQLSPAQQQKFAEEITFPYLEERIEVLTELTPPKADAKEVEAIVAKTEDGLAQARKNADEQAENTFTKAETMSRAFGLKICGSSVSQ